MVLKGPSPIASHESMLRLARRALVFLVLGAMLTILSSWAIHAVQFRRAWLGSMSSGSFDRPPTNVELIDGSTAVSSQPAVSLKPQWVTWEPSDTSGAQRHLWNELDIDAAWRSSRTPPTELDPLPREPFPGKPYFALRPRFGWRSGISTIFSKRSEWAEATQKRTDHTDTETLLIYRVGWPFHAMQVATYSVERESEDVWPNLRLLGFSHGPRRTTLVAVPKHSFNAGLELWTRPNPSSTGSFSWSAGPGPLDRFALPMAPLGAGYAANTLVFAVLVGVLWQIPARVRWLHRRLKGRCTRCGYDITGLTTCPECGHSAAP